MTVTPRQRAIAARMDSEEHAILLEVFCRFWPGDWHPKWEEWIDWWHANKADWLGPRRAFGVWLRRQEDARTTPAHAAEHRGET